VGLDSSVELTLFPDQIKEADALARERNAFRRSVGSKPRNGQSIESTMEDDILGLRCERACEVYLRPIEWIAFTTRNVTGLPDFSDWIDCKGIPTD
jgi:hypothetical protein